MFCSRCGTQLSDTDRFCSKCGKAAAMRAPIHEQHTPDSKSTSNIPLSFGSPVTRWWLPFKGKGAFPAGYEWLEQRNTLLVCRNPRR